jgi:hypothetical protein
MSGAVRLVFVLMLVGLGGCVREKIVYRDAPTGSTPVVEATPAPPSLRFPQGVPESEIAVIPGLPTLGDVVNQEIAAMFPNCNVGQVRCDGLGYSAQSFFVVLNDRLRKRGLWAGQHRDGVSDEMTVAVDCKGEWQNFHAWDYNGSPLWSNPVSQPCAGHACTGKSTSYRGNTIIPAGYCR